MPSEAYHARFREHYKNYDPKDPGQQLLPDEHFWLELQPWLEAHGYMLRPRYRPGWIPSWKGTDKYWLSCEDGHYHTFGPTMDAKRIADGKTVALKKIIFSRNPDEIEINKFLSSEPLASNPKNHCLPILDILQVPDEEDIVITVMPFVRPFDNPRFETFGEVIDFFRQIFEGLQFMHDHHVAHRDCTTKNIMMEANTLYPNGFHPVKLDKNFDYHGNAKHYTRTDRPPKYYLIDFGLSQKFDPDDGPPLAEPVRGGDKTVPEFQGEGYDIPSDPFWTDIYYLGNMIQMDFIDRKFGFEFMLSLVADMTKDIPSERPNIDQVVARFEVICRSLSTSKLRSRVVPRKPYLLGWWHSSVHVFRTLRYVLQRVPPVPSAI